MENEITVKIETNVMWADPPKNTTQAAQRKQAEYEIQRIVRKLITPEVIERLWQHTRGLFAIKVDDVVEIEKFGLRTVDRPSRDSEPMAHPPSQDRP